MNKKGIQNKKNNIDILSNDNNCMTYAYYICSYTINLIYCNKSQAKPKLNMDHFKVNTDKQQYNVLIIMLH